MSDREGRDRAPGDAAADPRARSPAVDRPPDGEHHHPLSVADGADHPVDPAWITSTRITSAIAAAMLAVPLVLGAVLGAVIARDVPVAARLAWSAAVAIAVVGLGWSAIVLPVLRYRHLRYRLDTQGLGIRRGVWWRSESWVPRSRIQHTDVTQGPVERAFGLATLVLFTAGTEHARVTLEGLREERARAIRDHLVDGGDDDGV